MEVYIRFRFDKSPQNFTIRKFGRGKGYLCPLAAAISIILRSFLLGVKDNEPVGVYRTTNKGAYTYLQSKTFTKVMQQVCIKAYPDPNHYLRKHITLIQAHSNRITAAAALKRAGKTDEFIAFRIRWSLESVKHYLRECQMDVGQMTMDAIMGAFMLE